MQDDSGGIDDRPQGPGKETLDHVGDDRLHIGGEERQGLVRLAGDACPKIGKGGPSDFDKKRAIDARGQSSEARLREEFVDGGNLPQEIRLFRRQNAPVMHRHADISSQGGA